VDGKVEKGDASLFQWQDMLRGDLILLSLSTHKDFLPIPMQKVFVPLILLAHGRIGKTAPVLPGRRCGIVSASLSAGSLFNSIPLFCQ
jgi:hypothetical protein